MNEEADFNRISKVNEVKKNTKDTFWHLKNRVLRKSMPNELNQENTL